MRECPAIPATLALPTLHHTERRAAVFVVNLGRL